MTAESRLSMPLGEAIFSLRAIRRLKLDLIPDANIQDILEAAIRAPNGGNAQQWHFLVVKDAKLRAQLGTLYHEAWWAKRRDAGIHKPEDLLVLVESREHIRTRLDCYHDLLVNALVFQSPRSAADDAGIRVDVSLVAELSAEQIRQDPFRKGHTHVIRLVLLTDRNAVVGHQ